MTTATPVLPRRNPTRFELDGLLTMTRISVTQSGPQHSTAPNGASSSVDYYTAVVYREDWADVPANGIYAGRSYRIIHTYLSGDPRYAGQRIGSSSTPWTGPAR